MELLEASGGFERVLGLEYPEAGPDRVVITCPIRPELLQPYGILHGGVYCSLVETAASVGAGLWFAERGRVVGVSNTTHFLRVAREGVLTATATPIHRGRTQQLWLVQVTGDGGRDLARGEVRLANVTDPAVLGTPTAG